jgi:hypothetical protein
MRFRSSEASCMSTLNTDCFPGTNELPPYITFDNVSFNFWLLWFSYSGPWIWCGLHSFFAFCRSGTRRRKPVRRSTTRVKALSMGSKLQLAVGRWMKIVA